MKTFLKWAALALLVGSVGGVTGSLFHICIDLVTEVREENGWVIYFLPLGGVVIAALYGLSKKKLDTNRVINAISGDKSVPFVMAPLIFVSTVITHFLGGSAGREGAALQLGGSLGYNIGKLFKLSKNDIHLIVMAGMSAVFAALFGTPLTAMFFCLEVTSVGLMYYAGFLPCLISAFAGALVARLFGISPVRFELTEVFSLSLSGVARAVVIAIASALVCALFCKTIEYAERIFEKYIGNKYLRAIVGGALIVVLTLVLGTYDYNGAGMGVIEKALSGNALPSAFLMKIIFTAITIAAGFKGGEIVPTFFIGATFGCVLASLLGFPPQIGAAIGFIALFCGAVNCPVASVVLALEVFGEANLPILAIACGISYLFSGYGGLYKSQRIMYSKFETKFINETVR